jgi:hypothetical protein
VWRPQNEQEITLKKCVCGKELASNARTCPNCGKRFTHPFVMVLAVLFGLMVVGGLISVANSGNNQTDTSSPAPAPGVISKDPAWLIAQCGNPSKDTSTLHDHPRPSIPTRILKYNNTHLSFAYVYNEKIGNTDSWKLIGVTDTQTNTAIAQFAKESSTDVEALRNTLTNRLPCALNK